MTENDKITLSRLAIRSVLVRIKEDKDIRYHIGAGTQTFNRLCVAFAALESESLEKVMDAVIPGSSAVRHETVEETLERA